MFTVTQFTTLKKRASESIFVMNFLPFIRWWIVWTYWAAAQTQINTY